MFTDRVDLDAVGYNALTNCGSWSQAFHVAKEMAQNSLQVGRNSHSCFFGFGCILVLLKVQAWILKYTHSSTVCNFGTQTKMAESGTHRLSVSHVYPVIYGAGGCDHLQQQVGGL